MEDSILFQVKGANSKDAYSPIETLLIKLGFKYKNIKVGKDGTFKTKSRTFGNLSDAIYIQGIKETESKIISDVVMDLSRTNDYIYFLDFQGETFSDDLIINKGEIKHSSNLNQ